MKSLFPITIIDNFFDEPELILKLEKELDYVERQRNHPAMKTQNLMEVFPGLFQNITKRVMSSTGLVPEDEFKAVSASYFQKSKSEHGIGQVHHDGHAQVVCIIYLNKDSNSGTSIYKKKDNFIGDPNWSPQDYYDHDGAMKALDSGDWATYNKIIEEYNNTYYEKTIDIKGEFNRALIYPSEYLHAVNNHDTGTGEDRLIMINQYWDFVMPLSSIPSARMKKFKV